VKVPPATGLGVKLGEEALAKYRIEWRAIQVGAGSRPVPRVALSRLLLRANAEAEIPGRRLQDDDDNHGGQENLREGTFHEDPESPLGDG